MFDFGYDLQGLQQIEIYKGASGAIFGPAAIGGAINFVTDIDYVNSLSINGSNSRNNSISGNYTHISKVVGIIISKVEALSQSTQAHKIVS